MDTIRQREAQYLVVGAGAAGCVIARRLAEADGDVLLLEAGPDTRALPPLPPTHLPLGTADPRTTHLDTTHLDTTHLDTTHLDTRIVRGVGAGGSGQINGAAWAPATAETLAQWPPPWPQAYADGLDKARTTMRPTTVPTGPLAQFLVAHLPAAHLHPGMLTIDGHGRRRTPWQAYQPTQAGSRVAFRSAAQFLVTSPGEPAQVIGLATAHGDMVRCETVILTAGAIGTAELLSTLPAAPAEFRGIEHPEVVLDVPAQVAARLGSADAEDQPAGILTERISFIVDGRRIEVRPYRLPFSEAIAGLAPTPIQIGVALMDPTSRVRGRRGGALDYRLAADDDEVLRHACATVADALGVGPSELGGVRPGWSQHLFGTAALGSRTSAMGEVPGVRGLRVADAALLPSGLGVGPYASTFVVAEAVAADILA